jgi:hypothetical protein
MNFFHLEAKVVSRGAGRSAVAAAAYASCSELYNDYDGVTHNFSRKQGCIYSEIFLPDIAPREWYDRETLWNAVEEAEKTKDSRLARELIVALPTELPPDTWKEMIKKFINEQCVALGMCADASIHDTDGHNPHAHILLTVRPLDDKGRWQAKTQKEYLCRLGDEEHGFTAEEFKTAQDDGWEKQYQYRIGNKKVYMTPSEAQNHPDCTRASKTPKSTRYGRQNPISAVWNSEEQLLTWRKAWEDVVNNEQARYGIDDRVDCRSHKERGITEQPTVHEGYHARQIEAAGYISERCELNRRIKADNKLLQELKSVIRKLTQALEYTAPVLANALESIRTHMITIQYERLFNDIQYDYFRSLLSKKLPLLEKYHAIQLQLKSKISDRKSLQAEQKTYSPLQVVKNIQISAKISALTEDIEELKNDRSQLFTRLECSNDKQIKEVERKMNELNQTQAKLKDRQSALTDQINNDNTKYSELQEYITLDNLSEVRAERELHSGGNRINVIYKLKDIYKDQFNRRLFDEAEKLTDSLLIDKTFSREEYSLHERLRKQNTPEKIKQPQPSRKKRYEVEL